MTLLSDLTSVVAHAIVDHEIHLFYETDHREGTLTFHEGPAAVLGDLAKGPIRNDQTSALQASIVPQRLSAALTERYALAKAFVRVHNLDIGKDFHDHIADLASGRRDDLLKAFGLSEVAKRLLSKGDLYPEDTPVPERKTHCLVLDLSRAAANRLRNAGITARTYRIAVDDATVFVFRTGKGFTQVRVTVHREDGGQLSALELLEVQIALGRIHSLHWLAADETVRPRTEGTTLGSLVRSLVLGPTASTHVAGRVSTYTYMRFDEPIEPDAADRLALYSARHYSSDYVVVPKPDGLQHVRHFETVGHAMALEGACTIVAPTAAQPTLPDYLKTFKENTFRKHYVPLMLLALHEHGFLIDHTSRSVLKMSDEETSETVIESLSALRHDSLVFRLLYRFSQVSYITMHNAVSLAFRDVLGLESMDQKLSQDVAEIEAQFQTLREKRRIKEDRKLAERQHERDRRYYFTSVVGTAALAGFTTFTIIKEGGAVFHQESTGSFYGFWSGVGLFILACLIGYLKRPRAHIIEPGEESDTDFTMHAALEHMLHAANK